MGRSVATFHNGTPTSAEGASKAQGRAFSQKEVVYQYIRRNPNSSRQEIADGTEITLQAVCARVASLIQDRRICESLFTKMGSYGTHVKTLVINNKEGA